MPDTNFASDVAVNEYGAEKIQVLKGLEPVRERPAMYIGNTGVEGLHHLVYEVVDNSIDEAMPGHCNEIKVTILRDGTTGLSGIPLFRKSPLALLNWGLLLMFGFFPWQHGEAYTVISQKDFS